MVNRVQLFCAHTDRSLSRDVCVFVCVCGRWAVDRDLGAGGLGGRRGVRGRERRCTVAPVTRNEEDNVRVCVCLCLSSSTLTS